MKVVGFFSGFQYEDYLKDPRVLEGLGSCEVRSRALGGSTAALQHVTYLTWTTKARRVCIQLMSKVVDDS